MSTNTPTILELRTELETLTARIEALRTQTINANDHRLAEMWECANEVADDNDMCPVYDEILGDLGAPGRERTYRVSTRFTLELLVDLEAEAISPANAMEYIDDLDQQTLIDAIVESVRTWDYNDISIDSFETLEAVPD